MGGKAGVPDPTDKGPSVGGFNLPNPLNPAPPGKQMLGQAVGGKAGSFIDPIGAKGGKGGGKGDSGGGDSGGDK